MDTPFRDAIEGTSIRADLEGEGMAEAAIHRADTDWASPADEAQAAWRRQHDDREPQHKA